MKTLPFVLATTALVLATGAYAGGDLSRADPVEIVIEMGQVDAKQEPAP